MALKMEVAKAVEQGSIAKSFKKDPILTFKEYCVVAYIATKYAVLRVRQEEKSVTAKRKQLITANDTENFADSDISDEYATFVLA